MQLLLPRVQSRNILLVRYKVQTEILPSNNIPDATQELKVQKIKNIEVASIHSDKTYPLHHFSSESNHKKEVLSTRGMHLTKIKSPNKYTKLKWAYQLAMFNGAPSHKMNHYKINT